MRSHYSGTESKTFSNSKNGNVSLMQKDLL